MVKLTPISTTGLFEPGWEQKISSDCGFKYLDHVSSENESHWYDQSPAEKKNPKKIKK